MVDEEPRGWGILPSCIYGGGEGVDCHVRKKVYPSVVVVMVEGMGGRGVGGGVLVWNK